MNIAKLSRFIFASNLSLGEKIENERIFVGGEIGIFSAQQHTNQCCSLGTC